MKKIKYLIVISLTFFIFAQSVNASVSNTISAVFDTLIEDSITGAAKLKVAVDKAKEDGIAKTTAEKVGEAKAKIDNDGIAKTVTEKVITSTAEEAGKIAAKADDKNAKEKAKKDTTKIVVSKATFKCSDVKYLTSVWLFIRIAAPFIIVLFGSLDFLKAVAAGDEKKMMESKTNFIKRLVAFLLLIILPFVVQFIFTSMGTYGSNNVCLLKCIATNDTSDKGCD